MRPKRSWRKLAQKLKSSNSTYRAAGQTCRSEDTSDGGWGDLLRLADMGVDIGFRSEFLAEGRGLAMHYL
jgi:hypothetical protein